MSCFFLSLVFWRNMTNSVQSAYSMELWMSKYSIEIQWNWIRTLKHEQWNGLTLISQRRMDFKLSERNKWLREKRIEEISGAKLVGCVCVLVFRVCETVNVHYYDWNDVQTSTAKSFYILRFVYQVACMCIIHFSDSHHTKNQFWVSNSIKKTLLHAILNVSVIPIPQNRYLNFILTWVSHSYVENLLISPFFDRFFFASLLITFFFFFFFGEWLERSENVSDLSNVRGLTVCPFRCV